MCPKTAGEAEVFPEAEDLKPQLLAVLTAGSLAGARGLRESEGGNWPPTLQRPSLEGTESRAQVCQQRGTFQPV